jgi:hypothetical protein
LFQRRTAGVTAGRSVWAQSSLAAPGPEPNAAQKNVFVFMNYITQPDAPLVSPVIPRCEFQHFPELRGSSQQRKLPAQINDMTMLFFSSDDSEVQAAARNLLDAGIACEIRHGPFPDGMVSQTFEAELWVRDDSDAYRALMLCVQLGIGFAKRAVNSAALAAAD